MYPGAYVSCREQWLVMFNIMNGMNGLREKQEAVCLYVTICKR